MKALLSSKIFQQALGLGISAVLIGWMIMSMEWHQVAAALGSANYWAFIPALIIAVVHYYVRAVRWRYLLPKIEKQPRLQLLFDSMMIGNFANYVLPLRAGEFIRPMILARQSDHRFPTGLVSVVIERFFDLAAVLLSFALLLLFIDDVPEEARLGALAFATFAGALCIVLVIGTYLPKQLKSISDFFLAYLPEGIRTKLARIVDDLLLGLAVLRSSGNLIMVLILTVVTWVSCFLLFAAFLAALNIPVTFLAGTTVAVITALAVAAPSAPGFIGSYQVGCVAALKLFGVNENVGIAYSLATHAFFYVVIVGYGLALLAKYNLKVGEMRTSAEAAAESKS